MMITDSKNKKKRWLLGAIILAAILSAGLYYQNQKKTDAHWQIVMPERKNISVSVNAAGVVEPRNRLEIKPPISGRIEKVLVKEGQRLHKGQILAWMSSQERAALLDAARAQGQTEYQRWEKIYKPAPIVAPMDGTLIALNAQDGQTLTTQDVPLVMSDLLIVQAQVDETDIGRIYLEEKALIVPDAYPQQKILGRIKHIAFEAQTINNVTVYKVEVLPQKLPDFMRAGMSVNVTVKIEEKENVLTLPSSIIQVENDKKFVWIAPKEKEMQPSKCFVQTGITDGKDTEIVHGLSADEKVVWDIKTSGDTKKSGKKNNPFSPMGRRRQ